MDNSDNLSVWNGWEFTKENSDGKQGHNGRNKNRTEQRIVNEKKFLALLDTLVPGCKAGGVNLIFAEDTLKSAQDFISNIAAQRRAAKHLKNFLRAALVRGKQELGWQGDIPALDIPLINSSNPHTPESFIDLNKLRNTITQFEKTLTKDWSTTLNEQSITKLSWGRFIFSAVVIGGLLDRKALLQLPFAKPHLRSCKGYVWIDLFTSDYNDNVAAQRGVRRWFLDPVSLSLFVNLPDLSSKTLSDSTELSSWIEEALYGFLYYLSDKTSKTPPSKAVLKKTLNSWFNGVEAYYNLILPPYLTSYCAGQVPSSAWPEAVWLRILLNKKQPDEPLCADVDLDAELEIQGVQRNTYLALQQSAEQTTKRYQEIKKALYRGKNDVKEPAIGTVQKKLKELIEPSYAANTLLGCLLEWISTRISRDKIKRSSAYQILTSIGTDLLSRIDDRNLSILEADDFYAIYKDILENTSPASANSKNAVQRSKLAQLLSFHSFAVAKLEFPPLSLKLTNQDFFVLPDANILTENEYQLIYKALKSHADKHDAHIQLIMLILGYRCGLRISEVQHLKLQDIQYRWMHEIYSDLDIDIKTALSDTACTLLVRANAYNKLKTNNSQRWLPLNSLLSQEERIELLMFHQIQRRKIGINKPDALLFSETADNDKPVDFTNLQSQLHKIFRELTGSPKLRFHHLRHSFLTYSLQASNTQLEPLLLSSHLLPSENPEKRVSATRKSLFEISTFAGHANPAVTLNHYIHNLDCIIRNKLWLHSFEHRSTGFDSEKAFMATFNTAKNIELLLDLEPDNLRQKISRHGDLLTALAKDFKISDCSKRNGWVDYSPIDIDKIYSKKIGLDDLNFDQWCGFLQSWSKQKTINDLTLEYYLDHNLVQEQVKLVYGLFSSSTRFLTSRLVRRNKSTANTHEFVLRPPHTITELDIARHCFDKCLIRLQSVSAVKQDSAKVALQYFFENFRRSDSIIRARFDSKNISRLKTLEHLLAYVLPKDITRVETTKNPAGHREFNLGTIKILSDKNASDGAHFGLIVAYVVFVLRTLRTDKQAANENHSSDALNNEKRISEP